MPPKVNTPIAKNILPQHTPGGIASGLIARNIPLNNTPEDKVVISTGGLFRSGTPQNKEVKAMITKNTRPLPVPTTVTVHPADDFHARNRELIGNANELPDFINNVQYISSSGLFSADHFYIIGATRAPSTLNPERTCAHFTVLVSNVNGEYDECTWTPDLSPERERLCKVYDVKPDTVVGPLNLEGVGTGKANQYMKMVNHIPF